MADISFLLVAANFYEESANSKFMKWCGVVENILDRYDHKIDNKFVVL